MHHDDPVLQKCRAILQDLYGERLHGVMLYGSCARGTEETESDIDLMVLLQGPVDGAQEIRRMWEVLYPLQLESEHLLSVVPVESRSITEANMPCIGRRRRRAWPCEGVVTRNRRAVVLRL